MYDLTMSAPSNMDVYATLSIPMFNFWQKFLNGVHTKLRNNLAFLKILNLACLFPLHFRWDTFFLPWVIIPAARETNVVDINSLSFIIACL